MPSASSRLRNTNPSSFPPLDGNLHLLALMFKGILVALSPVCGWLALKLILFVFNNPQYFLFTWLVALTIGLIAEFCTDTWRPTRLTGVPPPTAVPVQSDHIQKEQPLVDATSPTVLFKSRSKTEEDSQSNVLHNDNEDEDESSTVRVETRVKVRSSRSRSSSGSRNKGFGKPVLVRMDYKLESSSKVTSTTAGSESKTKDKVTVRGKYNNADDDAAGDETLLIKTAVTKSKQNSQNEKGDTNNHLNDTNANDALRTDQQQQGLTASHEWGLFTFGMGKQEDSANDNINLEVAMEATEQNENE